MRAAWVSRRELDPHPPQALKPALLPLLPPDCELRVYTQGPDCLVAGATLGGHRIVWRTHRPPQTMPAADWAAGVAAALLSWRPPAPVAVTAAYLEAFTRPAVPPAAAPPSAPVARQQLTLAL